MGNIEAVFYTGHPDEPQAVVDFTRPLSHTGPLPPEVVEFDDEQPGTVRRYRRVGERPDPSGRWRYLLIDRIRG